MRRLAMGSSAQSFDGSGSAGSRLDGRSLATRGASGKVKGSGAPAGRRFATLLAPLAVVASLFAFSAAPALAANPPKVGLGITIPSDTALTWATLGGTINPEGQATTYHFEYGKTTAYGDSAPAVDASAGSGSSNVTVTRAISELALNTTYHYRLVATNASGTTSGPDLTFDTGPGLGNGMHYELVSPSDTNGAPTAPREMSLSGDRINLSGGAQGFGDVQTQHGTTDTTLSTRTSSGWVTTTMNPPQNANLDNFLGRTFDMTSDLGTQLTLTATKDQFEKAAMTFRLVRPGDLEFKAFPEIRDLTGNSAESENVVYSHLGSSDDLNHLFIANVPTNPYLPGDPVSSSKTETSLALYEVTASPPALRNVAVDNAGNPLAPVCFGPLGNYATTGGISGRTDNDVSADGSKIFFGVRPGTPITNCQSIPARLYARINGTETVEISASECSPACATPLSDASFAGASNDGSAVFFTTVQQLVNGDLDTTRDLYRYDFSKPAGQHLSLVSKGEVTPGTGAQVKNVVQTSSDGSHVYFVAAGVLATNQNSYGQAAQAAANNLYLYEPGNGKTTFVARLDAGDSQLWGDGSSANFQFSSASGRFAAMSVVAKLDPTDTDSVADIYRYDAQTGQLLRVTPGNTADAVYVRGGSTGYATPPNLNMSDDGSAVAFSTNAALDIADTNGVSDVYLWREGSIYLISNGTAPRGSESAQISAGGNQVAFSTGVSLLPKDANSAISAYVARTGADVEPVIVPPTPPCSTSDACRGSAPVAPAGTAPVTPSFSGPGNDPTPAPTPKPKHHKKKHHKKKHQQKKSHRTYKHTTRHAG